METSRISGIWKLLFSIDGLAAGSLPITSDSRRALKDGRTEISFSARPPTDPGRSAIRLLQFRWATTPALLETMLTESKSLSSLRRVLLALERQQRRPRFLQQRRLQQPTRQLQPRRRQRQLLRRLLQQPSALNSAKKTASLAVILNLVPERKTAHVMQIIFAKSAMLTSSTTQAPWPAYTMTHAHAPTASRTR